MAKNVHHRHFPICHFMCTYQTCQLPFNSILQILNGSGPRMHLKRSFKLFHLQQWCTTKANVITVQKPSVSLGWSCHIHEWAIRLASCAIHLTTGMLWQFTTFGCQPQEEAEVLRKKWAYTLLLEELHQNVLLWPFAVLPIFTQFCARSTQKVNETRGKCFSVKKTFVCRDGCEKSTETRYRSQHKKANLTSGNKFSVKISHVGKDL